MKCCEDEENPYLMRKEVRERDTELKDIDKAIKPFQNKSGNDERRLATIPRKNLGKRKNSRFHVVGVDNLYLRKERYGEFLHSYDCKSYKVPRKMLLTRSKLKQWAGKL